MFEWIFTVEDWVALLTLTALEVVLGIDNIIFISVLVGKLPQGQRDKARKIGLTLAMVTRLLLLSLLFWLAHLSTQLFSIFDHGFTARDVVLIAGGLFLLWKSTMEIHDNVEGASKLANTKVTVSFFTVISQIAIIDIVFSLDSVITAIGMVNHIMIMVIAIIIAVLFMIYFSKYISNFVDDHPTIKILALSFLLMVGLALIGDGFGMHIPKGYIYFAMTFSALVEILNLRMRKRKQA
jgi:predicted tellurium resistance membrane protein TerC